MASPSEVSEEQSRPDEQVSSQQNSVEADNDSSRDDEDSDDDSSCDYETLSKYLPLIKNAFHHEWEKVFNFLEENPDARTANIDGEDQTFLDMAVGYSDEEDILREIIMEIYNDDDWEKVDLVGVLQSIGSSGNLTAARILRQKFGAKRDWEVEDEDGHPVAWAAARGQKELAMCYLTWTNYIHDETLDDDKIISRFCRLVNGDLFGPALELLRNNNKVACKTATIKDEDEDNDTEREISCLDCLAGRSQVFLSGSQLGFWDRLIYRWMIVNKGDKPSYDIGDPGKGTVRGKVPLSSWNVIKILRKKLKDIRDMKLMHLHAEEMLDIICSEIDKSEATEEFDDFIRAAVLTAAKHGNYEVLVKILRYYPPAIYFSDPDDDKGVFHLAVALRHPKFCSLLYHLGPDEEWVTGWVDEFDNNIMHYAARLPPDSNRLPGSGPVLKMQREMQWFKVVESLTTSVARKKKTKKQKAKDKGSEAEDKQNTQEDEKQDNSTQEEEDKKDQNTMKNDEEKKDDKENTKSNDDKESEGKTPRELFTIKHKALKEEAEKTIKETAQSSTVVAALIATVAFAAAFTVPGGNDGATGKPIYLTRTSFMVFIISDALALFSSTTAVLVFTVILTSPFTEEDFLVALPLKLILSLISLSFSAACMMVSFCAGIHLVLSSIVKLIAVPIGLLAIFPVAFFIFLQLPFLIELLTTTFGSAHLPSPEKARLRPHAPQGTRSLALRRRRGRGKVSSREALSI